MAAWHQEREYNFGRPVEMSDSVPSSSEPSKKTGGSQVTIIQIFGVLTEQSAILTEERVFNEAIPLPSTGKLAISTGLKFGRCRQH